MNTVIGIYALGYLAWSIAGVVNDVQSKYSLWVVALNVLVSASALFGIYFYVTQSAPQFTLHVWKAIFCAIVIGECVLLAIDGWDALKEQQEDAMVVASGLGVSIVLIVPALVINYLLAFGG